MRGDIPHECKRRKSLLQASPIRRHLRLAAAVFTASASLLVVLVYVAYAWELVSYPWDWSPDEGLYLDFARRLLDAPGSLYNERGVPVPAIYGPLFPALLAPVVRLANPLAAARVLTLAFTLLGALAVGALIRRRAGVLWASAGAALYLAIFDIASWFMLVRIDTPLLALWLWSAVLLLPRELRAGADRLSRAADRWGHRASPGGNAGQTHRGGTRTAAGAWMVLGGSPQCLASDGGARRLRPGHRRAVAGCHRRRISWMPCCSGGCTAANLACWRRS